MKKNSNSFWVVVSLGLFGLTLAICGGEPAAVVLAIALFATFATWEAD